MADRRRRRLDPATATVRRAVRAGLADLVDPGDLVLAACSGGADSLALAAALAFEADRLGVRAGAVTVDHGLQPRSAERSVAVGEQLTGLGLRPVLVRATHVDGIGGPEAAARTARYRELTAAAQEAGARLVLLGHTRDDQAESVLLGLARGSGARSLAGMDVRRPVVTPGDGEPGGGQVTFLRPLLDLPRAVTTAACEAAGLSCWADPHNVDPAFTRARVRQRVLPVLERELGPGVAGALARSAAMLRDDADALDAVAAAVGVGVRDATGAVDVESLVRHPRAVRTRVLRSWLIEQGSPVNDLTRAHVLAVDALATAWHGQGPLSLPGRLYAVRERGPSGRPVLRTGDG